MREVRDANGRVSRRVVEPYTSDIGGVIVTYYPVSSRLTDEAASKDVVQSLTMEMAQIGVWTLSGDAAQMDWDDSFAEITGLTQTGQSLKDSGFADCIFAEDQPKFESSLRALIEEGAAQNIELRFSAPGQPARWLHIRAERVKKDGNDMVAGILADITERKSDTERSDFMMRELDHRVKNLLAIILSIAEITGRSNTDIATFKSDFRARLESMARTHNLLSQTQWSGADLRALVEEEVFSLVPKGAVALEGPSLEISPSAAQSLAMFFHELTANALKHGALSTQTGRVAVSWEIDEPDKNRLMLSWVENSGVENGGVEVCAPSKEGFGGKVINRIVKRQLDAEVSTQWHAEGIELTASIPLQSIAPASATGTVSA